MSDTLLIHYNTDNPHQATWSVCNDAGELTGRITTGALTELSGLAVNHSVIVLLNSQCLHINQLQLPTQNMQKMLKAIPYAIEEFIAEDIENFHFVVAKNKHSDITSVVGIDKTTMNDIIDAFQQANIVIDKIIPDTLCLAANNTQWAYLNYQNNSCLQTDTLNGMTFSQDLAPYVMASKLGDENQELPEKILCFSEQEDSPAFNELLNSEPVKENNIEIIGIVYNTHPLVVFCGNYKQALPLNLLQHEFKTKRKTSGYWHHWRYAASIAFIWLILHLGVTSFQYSNISDENTLTKAEIEKIYKKSFPKSKKIVNPRVQMEQKLKELRSNSGSSSDGLVLLLAESFGILNYDKIDVALQTLTFRNNRLDIGLEGKNLQAIENLNKNLNGNKNIKSEITSSSSEKDKVKGNLRVEGRS